MFKSMIFKQLVILVPLIFQIQSVGAQADSAWVKLEKGSALLLNPATQQWVPVDRKEQVPLFTFMLTKPGTSLSVFIKTDEISLPSNGYFFIDDMKHRDRNEIVHGLVRIQASQLTVPTGKPSTPVAGMTYGKPSDSDSSSLQIPFLGERLNAVSWLIKSNRPDAAVLSMKRMFTRFPDLYNRTDLVEILLTLYEKNALWGYLYEESRQLLDGPHTEESGLIYKKWNETAKQRLTGR